MKARLIEQYDLTLGKREMDEVMVALRSFQREFESSELLDEIIADLDEVYQGSVGLGRGITPTPVPEIEDDEQSEGEDGGSAVPA